jgi:hypothetical protein
MSLPILQWNPINTECGEIKSSVYIKPTLSLLEFANRNVSNGNRTLMIQITGTDHPVYEGVSTLAILDKTSDVPELRQNFYNATGMYLLTLNLPWFGYPNKNGSVTFFEGILTEKNSETLKPQVKEPQKESVVENYESRTVDDDDENSENYQNGENYQNDQNDENDVNDQNRSYPKCGVRGMSRTSLMVIGLLFFTMMAAIFFLGKKR